MTLDVIAAVNKPTATITSENADRKSPSALPKLTTGIGGSLALPSAGRGRLPPT